MEKLCSFNVQLCHPNKNGNPFRNLPVNEWLQYAKAHQDKYPSYGPSMKTLDGQVAFLPAIARRAHIISEQTTKMHQGVFQLLLIHKFGGKDGCGFSRFPKDLLHLFIHKYLWNPSVWGKVSTRMTKEENKIYKISRKKVNVAEKVQSLENQVLKCDSKIFYSARKREKIRAQIQLLESRNRSYLEHEDSLRRRKEGYNKTLKTLKRNLEEVEEERSTQLEVFDARKKLKALIDQMTPEQRKELSAQFSTPEKE